MPDQLTQTLDAGLVLRAVESDADAEKVVAINTEIHGEGGIVRHWLFYDHPNLYRGGWLFLEDQETGQAVATLCLMPTLWKYGGTRLPVVEMGFVATLPDYRGRGLQRQLSAVFDRMALSQGYTLAAIEGIPRFYSQFGYEYAVPLLGGVDMSFDQVPEGPPSTGCEFRPATLADVPALVSLYDASIAALDVAARRDTALWTYQVAMPPDIPFYGVTTVIEVQQSVVGYLRWTDDDWTDRLRILELAVLDGPGAQDLIVDALRFACEMAQTSAKRGLRAQLPVDHPACVVARYLGGTDNSPYGWQMKVMDTVGFMQAIGPELESRLSQSLLAGYSGSLVFFLDQSRLALRFEAGKLAEVSAPSGEVEADARMTLKQATQLWLGWRGRAALEDWYPDFWSRPAARHLIDVLFPAARAYIYTAY